MTSLDTGELLAQAGELESIRGEFDVLLKNVESELGLINSSWSANLARNFSGKIAASRTWFDKLSVLLGNGSQAARYCAQNFVDTDTGLAHATGGSFAGSVSGGGSGVGSRTGGGVGGSAGGSGKDSELHDAFEKLPQPVKDKLMKLYGDLDKISRYEMTEKEANYIGKLVSKYDPTLGVGVKVGLKYAYGIREQAQNAQDFINLMEVEAGKACKNGEIGKMLGCIGKAIMAKGTVLVSGVSEGVYEVLNKEFCGGLLPDFVDVSSGIEQTYNDILDGKIDPKSLAM